MKKVINITIGTVVFFIEEDAYERLSGYLSSIRKHFGESPESEEVVEDIEISIAEKFTDFVREGSAITLEDVEKVVTEMGTVKDFEAFDEQNEAASTEDTKKTPVSSRRLYRDADDKIIGGVASGIALYFGIDPIIPRILFAVLMFANGFGFLAYLLLWVIVPKAESTSQKLEMRGEAVTIKHMSEFVENSIDV